MKYAFLARAPRFGATVKEIDDSRSKAVPGVTQVAKISDSAVAVFGDSVWAALSGRRVLKVTWDDGPNANLDSKRLMIRYGPRQSKKVVALFKAGEIQQRR